MICCFAEDRKSRQWLSATIVGRHSDHSQDMGILRQRRLAGAVVLLGLSVNIGDCTNWLFLAIVIGNVVMEKMAIP